MPNGDPVVYQLSVRIDELSKRLESLTALIVEGKKTQWGVIAAFSAASIMALGYLGDLALTPMKEKLAEIQAQLNQTASKDDVNKKLSDITGRLNELNLKIYKSHP